MNMQVELKAKKLTYYGALECIISVNGIEVDHVTLDSIEQVVYFPMNQAWAEIFKIDRYKYRDYISLLEKCQIKSPTILHNNV